MRTSKSRLEPRLARRTMRLSVIDGGVYAFMVGLGEVYFLADAIRLGASPLEMALIVSLPLFVGASGPLLALRILRRLRARKPLVVAAALGQATTLATLGAAEGLGHLTPATLIALVCLYQVFGQTAGTTWSSWFGDLVPERIRGRYFSRRNRAAYGATCLGLLAVGLVLHWIEPGTAADAAAGGGRGFAVLFGAAAVVRLVSVGLLAASAEPRFGGLSTRVRVLRYFASSRGTRAWRLVLLVASLQFTVYFAAPYFQPYMLDRLGFTYVEYMLASMVVVVAKIAFVPAWGGLVDQFGARQLCALCALAVALVPLPWLWVGGLGWVLVAQALSGFCWAGFEVSEFTLLLETTYRSTRLHVFAALSSANGLAQILGGLTGALMVGAFGDLRVVFAASFLGRLLVACVFPRLLPAPTGAPLVRHRDLLLRVVGFRPNGGIAHRPVEAQILPPADDDATRAAS